ncbi:MAG: type II toxin-antitoxin system RelE/ParE family toxin [Rubrivivax sp.]|nr:type II toxin-antitoxin system RelE/ParE family toxin [Rubrivivax sp.]
MSLSIHRLAAQDLAAAARYYRQEAGVGVARRFVAEFERVARMLSDFPTIGTPLADGRRSFGLTGFPYTVFYRTDERGLRVLVVRHQSRHPDFGEGRR